MAKAFHITAFFVFLSCFTPCYGQTTCFTFEELFCSDAVDDFVFCRMTDCVNNVCPQNTFESGPANNSFGAKVLTDFGSESLNTGDDVKCMAKVLCSGCALWLGKLRCKMPPPDEFSYFDHPNRIEYQPWTNYVSENGECEIFEL